MDDLRFRSSQHPAKHWRLLNAHGYASFTPSDFWQPPKLIVAVEAENWGPMMDEGWITKGWSRGFQIVQLDFTGPGVLYVHSSFDIPEKG
ncbi:hypothetical protein QFC24_006917 [Naganishia onofrii]|uniref:Uncharacterized protein n=1 Tax=Naganishia onofrii TaxID=1851511 RepID=A0ACC2WVB9_9TREE|nr:hypothetical protein QFC24_006917 [Naganishia onofrii]